MTLLAIAVAWAFGNALKADGHGWIYNTVYRIYCSIRLNLMRKAKKRVITRGR
jgi:hypothetical protein